MHIHHRYHRLLYLSRLHHRCRRIPFRPLLQHCVTVYMNMILISIIIVIIVYLDFIILPSLRLVLFELFHHGRHGRRSLLSFIIAISGSPQLALASLLHHRYHRVVATDGAHFSSSSLPFVKSPRSALTSLLHHHYHRLVATEGAHFSPFFTFFIVYGRQPRSCTILLSRHLSSSSGCL